MNNQDPLLPKVDPVKWQRSQDITELRIAISNAIPVGTELTTIIIALSELTKEYSWELANALAQNHSEEDR